MNHHDWLEKAKRLLHEAGPINDTSELIAHLSAAPPAPQPAEPVAWTAKPADDAAEVLTELVKCNEVSAWFRARQWYAKRKER